jgi:hypothetical protein
MPDQKPFQLGEFAVASTIVVQLQHMLSGDRLPGGQQILGGFGGEVRSSPIKPQLFGLN